MNRGLLLVLVFASLAAAQPARSRPPVFRLEVVPAIVYKVDDPGNTGTSTFVFDIAVICSIDCNLTPSSAHVELSSAGSIVSREDWSTAGLAKIKGVNYRVSPDAPVASPRRMFTLPEAFDLHFYFRRSQALAIDAANFWIKGGDARGHQAIQTLMIPIQYYRQKTSLLFPFRGLGVIGEDWVTNGGHGSGYGNDFAIDVRGLDENYAEQKNDANENASAVGWGRDIIAPAAGTVTYARNDVPNNPHPGPPDMNLFATLHDPVLATYGNCVVIDHGNSEYSVLAHMQEGSVTVRVGDRVVSGQVIGKLGNSGNAFGPHLHYQLQSGPRLLYDQSLPFRFQNINVPQLSRGRYVNEK